MEIFILYIHLPKNQNKTLKFQWKVHNVSAYFVFVKNPI